jgi:hypothetical protein
MQHGQQAGSSCTPPAMRWTEISQQSDGSGQNAKCRHSNRMSALPLIAIAKADTAKALAALIRKSPHSLCFSGKTIESRQVSQFRRAGI